MVTLGLLVIGVIIIGLPLLALGADRVLPLPRPRQRPIPPSRDPAEIVRTEFGLTWQDHLEVVAAVQQGRAAARPELRPAACRFAELVLNPPHQTFRGRPINEYPRWQRITVLVVFVAFVLVYVFAVVGRGGAPIVGYVVIYLLMIVVSQVVRRRRRRRAVEAATANH